MKEKQLTEKESLEIITSMIARTKERYVGDGRILLMWGYLDVAVAMLVWGLVLSTHNHAWHWLWFAIPLIGYPATLVMSRNKQQVRGVTTYSDKLSSKLWTFVGLSEFAAICLCLVFHLGFGINCWFTLMVYSLIAVSLAAIVQGVIIKEESFVAGGSIGLLIGLFALCCVIGRVALIDAWIIPLFILTFIAVMIIPGHALNYKAQHQ